MMQSVRRIVTFALLLVLTNQDEASLLPDVTLQQLITQQPHLLHLYAPLLSPARQLIHQVLDRSAELSQECANSLQAVVNGLDAHQTWALECMSICEAKKKFFQVNSLLI